MRGSIHFYIVAYEASVIRGSSVRNLMTLGSWRDITPMGKAWRIARKSFPHDVFDGVGVRTGYPLHVVIRDWSGVDAYGFNDYRAPWDVVANPRWPRSSG